MKNYIIKILILSQLISFIVAFEAFSQTAPSKYKPTPKPTKPRTSNRPSSNKRDRKDEDRKTIDPATLKMKRPPIETSSKEDNNPRFIFEKSIEKIKTVRLMQYVPDGNYDALPMMLDSVESIQMTFPQIMFNRILFLTIKPTNLDKPNLWVDLNNNEIREPNEIIDTTHKIFALKINENVVTFYGKIDTIQAYFLNTLPHELKKAVVQKGDEKFICDRINTIDFSYSKSIKYINFQGSNIEKAVFDRNPNLTAVYLDDNRMKSLDIKDCPKLVTLSCKNNQLRTIDPRGNSMLENFNCASNQLKEIPISTLTKLTNYICKNNKFESLDLSDSKELINLDASANQIKSIILKNAKLNSLALNNNQITFLNISECPELENLNCTKNFIYKFAFPKYSKIKSFSFAENQMKILDFSELGNLVDLNCNKNNFDSLDFTSNNNLINISASNNAIQKIIFAEDNDIEKLILSQNKIDSIDLSYLNKISYLDCSLNSITELDLSNCNSLEYLNVSNNKLELLNLSNNNAIKEIYCYNNALNEIAMADFITALKNVNSKSEHKDLYLLNNDLSSESNDISSSFAALKALKNWNIHYVETDSDSIINLNLSPHLYYAKNVYISYRGEIPFVKMKSLFIKINGVAPPFNVAITGENSKVITQYESAASFVDIKKLQSGKYSLRIAKDGKINFYYFIK